MERYKKLYTINKYNKLWDVVSFQEKGSFFSHVCVCVCVTGCVAYSTASKLHNNFARVPKPTAMRTRDGAKEKQNLVSVHLNEN